MPRCLVQGYNDTAATTACDVVLDGSLPQPSPDDDNPLWLLSSAPALEGARNCGSSQMQELLVNNVMGDSGSTRTSDPWLMTHGLWVWVRHMGTGMTTITTLRNAPSICLHDGPAYQWSFLLSLCRVQVGIITT